MPLERPLVPARHYRRGPIYAFLAAAMLSTLLASFAAPAQSLPGDLNAARRTLSDAQARADAARRHAERLEATATAASANADARAREGVALAARIQQTEAEITAANAEIALIDRQRADLRARLAARQRPLLQLTAALQLLARRPLTLALFSPGSATDTVHVRMLLAAMLPEVEARVASLRAAIAHGRALQAAARAATARERDEEHMLAARHQQLAIIETRERLAARDVRGSADREAERALSLAEQGRDLAELVTTLERASALSAALASLPGPLLPPGRGGQTPVATSSSFLGLAEPIVTGSATPSVPSALPDYMLPMTGRLIAGFGDASHGGVPSRGLRIATRPGAQVVAPAAGRVMFAGPYRGYGAIIILSHDGGWTSLITGLARLDARVGDRLLAGAPIGIAAPGAPVLGLELHHGGVAVDPLDFVHGG